MVCSGFDFDWKLIPVFVGSEIFCSVQVKLCIGFAEHIERSFVVPLFGQFQITKKERKPQGELGADDLCVGLFACLNPVFGS